MPDDLAETIAERAMPIFERLVAFDTTSRLSNLALIDYVASMLAALGVASHRVFNDDGSKANLYATLGPAIPGGVVLSGHTDVVPIDGQSWSSDPFVLTRRGDRLYGRGTCDMKGFIALALAAAPEFARSSGRPVHCAFSYDEEVGCVGAPSMIRELARDLPPPRAVIVGEPTNMKPVIGHKGISSWTVTVTGHEAHSSLTHLGVSANMVAVRLMHALVELADRLVAFGSAESGFTPAHPTLTIGLINGGTAINILARQCSFSFDLRTLPDMDADALIAPFIDRVAAEDHAIRQQFPDTGISIVRRSSTPALVPIRDSDAEALVRRLTGDNGSALMVPYAAEAGQFQQAGFLPIICGPGSIDQAHQPDEYIEMTQFLSGAAFMAQLARWASE